MKIVSNASEGRNGSPSEMDSTVDCRRRTLINVPHEVLLVSPPTSQLN
jgi:hypothetical protein